MHAAKLGRSCALAGCLRPWWARPRPFDPMSAKWTTDGQPTPWVPHSWQRIQATYQAKGEKHALLLFPPLIGQMFYKEYFHPFRLRGCQRRRKRKHLGKWWMKNKKVNAVQLADEMPNWNRRNSRPGCQPSGLTGKPFPSLSDKLSCPFFTVLFRRIYGYDRRPLQLSTSVKILASVCLCVAM